MHRRFSVSRDGKTAHERNVGWRAVPSLTQFGEPVWWMPLQPSHRRVVPLDSRFEQGSYLGPMDGSNTVIVGTASGVVESPNKQMVAARRNDGLLSVSCTKFKCTEVGISFIHIHVLDFMNRFPDTFQKVTDRSLFGPHVPRSMDTLTGWLTNSVCIAQAPSSSTHSSTGAPNDHERNSPQL